MAAQAKNDQQSTLTDEGTSVPSQKKVPEKVYFSWKAAERPFKKRNKEFWVTTVVIAAIFGLILFLVEGAMPVILIVSIVFLFYVLSTVEPEIITYQITNKGVKIAEGLVEWEVLTRFWFTSRLKTDVLVFEKITAPQRLEIVINEKDVEKIRDTLLDYINEEEVPPTTIEKATDWFAKKLPEGR